MKTRVIAACVLLPLLLVVVLVLPKIFTAILFGAMAAIGARELLQGTGLVKHPRYVTYAMVMAFFTAVWSSMWTVYILVLLGVFVFFCILFAEILISHKEVPFADLAMTFVAGGVVPFLFSSVVRLHNGENGRFLILLPFVIAFLSDTGAYFAGRAFGKHKLAPIISPNKTVEGLICGLAAALLSGIAVHYILVAFSASLIPLWAEILTAFVAAVAGAFGDLAASSVKREAGIKDYSNLIPGHGGMLDRADSTLFSIPACFMVYAFFI